MLDYKDENGKLKNRGKVYLGVSKEDKKIVREFAKKNTVARAWFDQYKNVTWLKPELVGTAHFMQERKTERCVSLSSRAYGMINKLKAECGENQEFTDMDHIETKFIK